MKKLKRGEHPENWKDDCPKFFEYYRKRNSNWTDEECRSEAKKFCRASNWQCIEYYEKKFPHLSHKEHLNLLEEKQDSMRRKSKFNIKYYETNYPHLSHEEHLKMLSKYAESHNCQNIKYYQNKYPHLSHEEHLKMMGEKKNKILANRPDNSGENNPAHRSKTTSLERRQRSPKCIEFYELKYPELTDNERVELLNSHLALVKSRMTPEKHSTRIEYWLAKGFNEEEAKQKLKERQQTFTLEHCIKKYGEEEGKKRFEARQVKWQKSLKERFKTEGTNNIPQSIFANNIISILKDKFKNIEQEFNLGRYSFDLRLNNKFIEFNGDYWHMNPNLYNENDVNKTTKKIAKDIWESDGNKIKYANKNGYDVLIIWESEYRNNPGDVINKCVDFLS